MLEVDKLRKRLKDEIKRNKDDKSLTYLQIARQANVTERTAHNAVMNTDKVHVKTLELIKNATEEL